MVRKKLRRRKTAVISQNVVQEKVCPRKSPRISTKVYANESGRKSVGTKKIRMNTTIQKKSQRISQRIEVTALEDDTVPTQNNSNAIVKVPQIFSRKIWDYKLDRTTNTITFEGVKFSILIDTKDKVNCKLCNNILRYNRVSMRHHIIKQHTNFFACSQCPFKGDEKNALDTHIQAVHNGIRNRKKTTM